MNNQGMYYHGLSGPNEYWWRQDPDTLCDSVFATVQHLDMEQNYRQVANLHYLRMYSNRMASSLTGYDYALQDDGDKIKLNVVKSVVDAAQSQIATNRPRPMYLTVGGSRSQIERAKNLNKFISGQFYALDQYDIGLKVFIDACVFGTGFEHIYEEGGKIMAERVFPDEIIVDDVEARDGNPRQLFRYRDVNRDVLIDKFPEHKGEIESAGLLRQETTARTRPADRVTVIEGWHLPTSDGSDDGRHTMCVSNATLVDEPYTRGRFPIQAFRWANAPLGYFGIGLAEELSSIQVEINYLLQKMQNLANLATTQIWTKKGEGIGKMDNQDMGHRTYKNTPPVALNVRPWAPEFAAQVDSLEEKAYRIAGVSMLQARAEKPAGLTSGEAIRTYNDITSQRFLHVGQRWERFHLGVADLIIQTAREIEQRGDGDIVVLAQGSRDIEEINFSDVSIDEDKYIARVYPASLLPDTPQGKIQTITELAQASPEMAGHVFGLLTGIPDLESVVGRINAPYELVDLYIERMVDHGEYNPPLPYMDLDLARQQAQLALQKGHKDGVEPERLDLLRQFVKQANDMIGMAQQTAGAAPIVPSPGPPGTSTGPGVQQPPGMITGPAESLPIQ